jgi:hypothetical protein
MRRTFPAKAFTAACILAPFGFVVALFSMAIGGIGICGPTTEIGGIVLAGGAIMMFVGVLAFIVAGLAQLAQVCLRHRDSADRASNAAISAR